MNYNNPKSADLIHICEGIGITTICVAILYANMVDNKTISFSKLNFPFFSYKKISFKQFETKFPFFSSHSCLDENLHKRKFQSPWNNKFIIYIRRLYSK